MPDHGSSFSVTPQSVAQLAGELTAVGSELDATAPLVGDCSSALGSTAAADALDGFVAGWRDGRRQICADLGSLAVMLAEAGARYLEAEGSVCAAIPVGTS